MESLAFSPMSRTLLHSVMQSRGSFAMVRYVLA
jgi:hypothetical protein